ncbi:hypothetical protein LTR22_028184 [Elasticomyces elasticus]|nr:hypothetical protein LTR22_028184 [Elasticomyces elasticus]
MELRTALELKMWEMAKQLADASISLQTLKANDLAKAQALQQFADQHDFVLYLASCEKEVSGDADEGNDDYDGYSRSKRRRYGYDDYGETSDEYHEITYRPSPRCEFNALLTCTVLSLHKISRSPRKTFCKKHRTRIRSPQNVHTLVLLVTQERVRLTGIGILYVDRVRRMCFC